MRAPASAVSLASLSLASLTVAAPSVSVNVSTLTTPYAPALVTWSGITGASTSDWITAVCLPSQAYFWWAYTDGSSNGSAPFSLFANGKSSSCDSIAIAFYSGSANKQVALSAPIAVMPMIQQVHLFPQTNASTMAVDFVSSSPSGGGAACAYGTDPGSLGASARAVTSHFATIGNMSHALLTGLEPNTRYFYTCGDDGATSELLSFTAAPQPADRPFTIAVWADFGVDDGFGLQQILNDAGEGAFDLVLHAGDWAYNLESDSSANGNFFFNRAHPYASKFAVAPAPGNHEAGNNFSEFQVRHGAVAAHSNTGTALYYSFEVNAGTPAGVHVLTFNSETYIDGGIEEMVNWITADLATVDRARTPWVVAQSHKLWWMDSTTQAAIVKQLESAGVDLNFAGHWHYYERYLSYSVPGNAADTGCMSADNHTYAGCKFPIQIVSGAPGDVERNDGCPGDPSLGKIVVTCTSQYGYGTLAIHNASHAYWQFTAQPTPIGEQRRGGRTPHREQAGYSDYAWIVRS